MNLVSGLLVYFLLWWLFFLALLPLGVAPSEIPLPGQDPGAPHRPYLWQKALGASLLAGFFWLGIDLLVSSDWISLRDLG